MTDLDPTDTVTEDDDLALYDDASDEFPSKFDLKDRLVLIWITGEKGSAMGSNGKPYDWYQTAMLVLDDSPHGYQEMRPNEDGEMRPNLVPSVEVNGPQELDPFRWSTSGIVARLAPRHAKKQWTGMLGRINSRKNKTKGHAPSWSISSPADADRAIADRYEKEIRAMNKKIKDRLFGSADIDPFA